MKKQLTLSFVAIFALFCVAAVIVPSTSWFRVAGNNATVNYVLTCTNADGSAHWAVSQGGSGGTNFPGGASFPGDETIYWWQPNLWGNDSFALTNDGYGVLWAFNPVAGQSTFTTPVAISNSFRVTGHQTNSGKFYAEGIGQEGAAIGDVFLTDIYFDDDDSAFTFRIANPDQLTEDTIIVFPNTNGLAGQVLVTDGASGNLHWATPSSSTQIVAAAIGSLTVTNPILPVVTNATDIGSFALPFRTNYANNFLAKQGITVDGATNGQIRVDDTNGTARVVLDADDLGKVTAMKAVIPTNTAPFTFISTNLVQGQPYTNLLQRASVTASVLLTNILAGDISAMSLIVDQDADGTWDTTNSMPFLGGVALSTSRLQLWSLLQPGARFAFTNQSAGVSPSATIVPGSCQWARW